MLENRPGLTFKYNGFETSFRQLCGLSPAPNICKTWARAHMEVSTPYASVFKDNKPSLKAVTLSTFCHPSFTSLMTQ